MNKPIAVIISDIHFTIPTLEVASHALASAMLCANKKKIPLVLSGDTLDSKAIIRGECANKLIRQMEVANTLDVKVYVIVGNHDLLNEKSSEHSLEFLKPYCEVIQTPVYVEKLESWLVPYHNDSEKLKSFLASVPEKSRLIMHQGVETAYLGHYVKDKTSLPKEYFTNFRVISGHYHRAQDIKCGPPRKGAVGLFSYVGNPYTLSFSEASDGPKGFAILHSNGLLERINTNLRKHVVIETSISELPNTKADLKTGDLVWAKLTGSASELDNTSKEHIQKTLSWQGSLKLDKIVNEESTKVTEKGSQTSAELFDQIIDGLADTKEHKDYLKILWKETLNETTPV